MMNQQYDLWYGHLHEFNIMGGFTFTSDLQEETILILHLSALHRFCVLLSLKERA